MLTETAEPDSADNASAMQRSMASTGWDLSSDGTAIPGRWEANAEQLQGLMKFLICTFGSKFNDQWRGTTPRELKAHWGAALAGYTTQEVHRGLTACMSRIWPPTLPEFLLLCRPRVEPEAAFIEAVKQTRARDLGEDRWSHPAVYWAAQAFGPWELQQATWASARERWTRLLAEQLERGASLPQVPARAPALPAPEPTVPAVAAERIERLSAAAVKPPGWDYLDWAKRPRSMHAWLLAQRGAESDPRLRDIVRHHIATQGRDCLCDDARKAVLAAGAAQPEVA